MTVSRRLVELGRSGEWAYEMVFAAVVGGLVGARLYYLVQNYDEVKNDLVGNIFSGSGLVWYGGAIGGARDGLHLGVAARVLRADAARRLRARAGDRLRGRAASAASCRATATTASHGTGRGRWPIPHGTVPTTQTVHPTPIYETLAMGLAAWALWRARAAFRPGVLFACYLVLAGTERFLVEFLRRNHEVAAGLTAPQFESLAMLAIGLLWVGLAARRGGLRPVSAYAPTG